LIALQLLFSTSEHLNTCISVHVCQSLNDDWLIVRVKGLGGGYMQRPLQQRVLRPLPSTTGTDHQ